MNVDFRVAESFLEDARTYFSRMPESTDDPVPLGNAAQTHIFEPLKRARKSLASNESDEKAQAILYKIGLLEGQAHVRLGNLYNANSLKESEFNSAIKSLNSALLIRRTPEVLFQLGVANSGLRNRDRAFEFFDEVIQADPDSAWSLRAAKAKQIEADRKEPVLGWLFRLIS